MRIRKESLRGIENISGLTKKLSNLPEPTRGLSVCCWTDLLGFGTPFIESNWQPNENTWRSVGDRIIDAHLQCYSNLDPMFEFVLTLNDGIVRCVDMERFDHLDCVSMWLRSCIWTHNSIGESEAARGLPGARTVLAAGPTLRYSHVEITRDDFVYNYTKPDPAKPGTYAQMYGDSVVAVNPGPLQMNLAFSRAYILDNAGSEAGITGPHLYVDESFFTFVRELTLVLRPDVAVIDRRETGDRLFAIPNDSSGKSYHLGFEVSGDPIVVSMPRIQSRVWRIDSFHPWDEDVADFKIPVR